MEMVWDIPIVVKPGKNAGVEFSVTQVLAVRMTRMFHAPVEAVLMSVLTVPTRVTPMLHVQIRWNHLHASVKPDTMEMVTLVQVI